MLNPRVIGVADGRRAEAPADVVLEELAGPVGDVERRVGENVVDLEVRVEVAQERVGGLRTEIRLDRADGEVHVRQTPRGGIGLLTEDGDVGGVAPVCLDEPLGLDEHAARAAAGVVDAAFVGFEHLDEHADDAARRVELAAQLAFRLRELAEEVLIHPAERVAGFRAIALETDVGDEVGEALELDGLDAAAGIVARELTLEVGIIALDRVDRVVDERGDVGSRRLILEVRPAGFRWNPENALGGVLVAVFQEGFKLLAGDSVGLELGFELFTARLERIGDVLEEEQPEDDVLVLSGVNLSTQGVCRFPERFGIGEVGVGVRCVGHACACLLRVYPVGVGCPLSHA